MITKLTFIIIVASNIQIACAQLSTIDKDLLINKKTENATVKNKITYIFKDRNVFVKYNPISLLFGGSLYFYQKVVSSQIQAGCAFDVSCSNFSKQSIKQFNLVKGIALSADRLTRCTRVSAVDFHPVMINKDGKCIDHANFYILTK